MSNVALDPLLWDELTSGNGRDTDELTAVDELDPSRGIIWWGFASLLLWLLLLQAFL